IRLLPAEAKLGSIRCNLFEVSFTEAPKYEALSYIWGEPGVEQTILIDDIERIIWVDATCINQTNVKERNHHVKQMKRIY
ncbi:hypothetical protein BDZ45DRAFT_560005, partial [Acephala macrosclerotiorum]